MHAQKGLTAKDLVRIASEHGYRVSEHQLERWRGAGLLPRAVERPGKGYGKGRVGIYAEGTDEQLLALLRATKEGRKKELWAWKLWLQGFPVTDVIRRQLYDHFSAWEKRAVRDLDAFEEEGESAILDPSQLRVPGILRRVRRRAGAKHWPTFIRMD